MENLDGIEYLTTPEVAALKGVPMGSVWAAHNKGRLAGRVVAGRTLIEKSAAEAWNPKHGGAERFKMKKPGGTDTPPESE